MKSLEAYTIEYHKYIQNPIYIPRALMVIDYDMLLPDVINDLKTTNIKAILKFVMEFTNGLADPNTVIEWLKSHK
jgi:hypothetical protein